MRGAAGTEGGRIVGRGMSRRRFLGSAAVGMAAVFGGSRPAAAGPRVAEVVPADEAIKAVYLNPVPVDAEGIARLVDLIARTELNAVVVDVKEDGVYFETGVGLFHDAAAVAPLLDPVALTDLLHAHGIYAIARLVVFRDDYVAATFPELAVRDRTTGDLWRDFNGGAWIDPFATDYWEAAHELAVEAASLGFDEVQYDYVRFPSDGDLSTMDFGQPATPRTRPEVIAAFLEAGRERLAGVGARIGADVFGFTLLVDELGIGQDVGRLAPVVDCVCPMVYPSHFPDGSLDVPGHPNDFPAETIAISLGAGAAKLGGDPRKLRPWLQDFSLPWLSAYGAAEVRAQIAAAEAAGAGGWMVWNALSEYHEAAFLPAG